MLHLLTKFYEISQQLKNSSGAEKIQLERELYRYEEAIEAMKRASAPVKVTRYQKEQ